jgi:hypothetical protein
VALTWVSAWFLINPFGDFPLGDDWAYGFAVRNLVESGDLRLSGWTATNLIAQVFWGALFCLPFGFSFTALRFSTLVLGLVGVLSTYGLLREARAPAGLALLGSIVLAFSPIYFALSYTFMNDVPFVAVATTSSWLLLRGLRRDSLAELLVGLALAAVAILIRQIGLAIPIAFAAAYLAKYGLRVKQLLVAATPVGVGFALQIVYQAWLRFSNRLPPTFGKQTEVIWTQLHQGLSTLLGNATTIVCYSIVYLGLFLFPFLIVVYKPLSARRDIKTLLLLILISAAITMSLAAIGRLMPLHGNVLTKGGIGDADFTIEAPSIFWEGATFLGVYGGILLVIVLSRSGKELLWSIASGVHSEARYILAFGFVLILIAFAPLCLLHLGSHGFYDRYLIFFLPLIMLSTVSSNLKSFRLRLGRGAMAVATMALLSIAMFSIASTHDYLASQRVRWSALNELMRDVSPEKIDGGFEFNGWYLYDDAYVRKPGKSWYWVADDEYSVSSFPREGYATLKTYPVKRWLPWGDADIVVQRRIGPVPGS